MTGSGIFAAGANGDAEESGSAAAAATPGRAASRNYQVLVYENHYCKSFGIDIVALFSWHYVLNCS